MFTLQVKLIAIAVALLALLGAVEYVLHHEQAIGEQRAVQAEARAASAAEAANAIETTRRETLTGENFRATELQDQQRAASARSLDAGVQRVHDAVTAPGRGGATDHPAVACESDANRVSATSVVCPGLFLRTLEAARDAAESLDCLRGASQLCADDYRALTP